LQQTIIDTIRLFLAIKIVHGTVTKPYRLFQVFFIIACINVVEIIVEQFQMSQGLHFKVFLLGNEFQWDDTSIGIDGKSIVQGFFIDVEHHPNGKETGQYGADDNGQNNEPVYSKDCVNIFIGCFHLYGF
tara:strand:- start:460 stop:849 length:390 start_codon:yes stop_codon:yes gene_type:complete